MFLVHFLQLMYYQYRFYSILGIKYKVITTNLETCDTFNLSQPVNPIWVKDLVQVFYIKPRQLDNIDRLSGPLSISP